MKQITFSEKGEAHGGNGISKVSGLLLRDSGKFIRVSTTNAMGNECQRLWIDFEKSNLDSIIDALKEIRDAI